MTEQQIYEYLARPGQLLKEHLSNVLQLSNRIVEDLPIRSDARIRNLVCTAALFHDVGKYTTFFQEKIRGRRTNVELSRHSYLSAVIAAAYAIKNAGSLAFEQYDPLIVFISIFSHHSDLHDTREEIPKITKHNIMQGVNSVLKEIKISSTKQAARLDTLEKQLADLRNNFENWICELEDFGVFIEKNELTVEVAIRTLFTLHRLLNKLEDESDEIRENLALSVQLVYSILLDADKKDASGTKLPVRREIRPDIVESYLSKAPFETTMMKSMRETLRSVLTERVKNLEPSWLNGAILTISAPTGAGKTLAALNFTLKLRDKICQAKLYTPRIIYCLPYISILEQNLEVIESVLSTLDDFDKHRSDYLIAHYHLAETEQQAMIEPEDYTYADTTQMLLESWDSEIVVTTFWQLLHTALGFKNRLMKKFYKLAGSIVVLDEVQTLPAEHWPLVEKFFQLLSRRLSTIFILMTATQPLILGDRKLELNDDFPKMFEKLDRTELVNETSNTDENRLLELVSETLTKSADASLLVVVNTISESIRKYRLIKDQLGGNVCYLSTNITPRERIERLRWVKDLIREKKGVVLVSTQVVEAGVDLDFDVVIRELSPLHSIVQVAGRCNRNGVKSKSKVYITNLNERAAKIVYGSIHIEVSKRLLNEFADKNGGRIPENQYLQMINEYFRIIRERLTKQAEIDEIWKNYSLLRFQTTEEEKSISDFRVIQSEPKVSIFVIKDDLDREVFEAFRNLLSEKDKNLRANMYARIKRKVQERMIHVSVQRATRNLPPPIDYYESLRFINLDSLETFYSLETGFKYTDEELQGGVVW